MRLSILSGIAALSLVGVLACNGEPLTGPAAQAAYLQAAGTPPTLVDSVMVYVDGRRLPASEGMPQLDAKTITRIEILKGAAAAKLYGATARNGVILIYTTRGTKAGTPTEQ